MPRRRSLADKERDFQAVDLRRRGMNHRQIAQQLGWKSGSSAVDAIARGLALTAREATEEVRQLELDKLDDLTRIQWRTLASTFVLASNGRVLRHPDTDEVLTDPAPHAQAAIILLRIAERRAKLLGLDRPIQHEVRTIDEIDARLIELADQMA